MTTFQKIPCLRCAEYNFTNVTAKALPLHCDECGHKLAVSLPSQQMIPSPIVVLDVFTDGQ